MNSRAPRVALLLLCLIILAAGTGVSAHQGPPKPDAAPSSPAASQSMVFERHYMRLRFESDGRSRRELTMHVRVADTSRAVIVWPSRAMRSHAPRHCSGSR